MKRTHWLLTGVAAAGMALSTAAMAQDQGNPPPGGNGGGGGGGGGGRGGFDPAQFREGMLTRIKESMQANDDEWNVIKPKVEKVMEAQRDTQNRGMFGGGRGGNRGGGGGGGGGGGNDSAVSKARQALTDLLQNNSASNDDIAAKVTAYREARDKAKESLTTSQKDLKEVLSPRQEAVLVGFGMLD